MRNRFNLFLVMTNHAVNERTLYMQMCVLGYNDYLKYEYFTFFFHFDFFLFVENLHSTDDVAGVI